MTIKRFILPLTICVFGVLLVLITDVIPGFHARNLTSSSINKFSDASTISNSTIKERGILRVVEDSGYPFFVLTIEFPERKFTEQFGINIEELENINPNKLNSWIGRYVSFEYTSNITNTLLALEYNGKDVLPNAGVVNDDALSIEGILSNAEQATAGDVPGEIYITTEEEIIVKFPFFIDTEIVKLNGKKVFAWYEQRTQNTISTINLIK